MPLTGGEVPTLLERGKMRLKTVGFTAEIQGVYV